MKRNLVIFNFINGVNQFSHNAGHLQLIVAIECLSRVQEGRLE